MFSSILADEGMVAMAVPAMGDLEDWMVEDISLSCSFFDS